MPADFSKLISKTRSLTVLLMGHVGGWVPGMCVRVCVRSPSRARAPYPMPLLPYPTLTHLCLESSALTLLAGERELQSRDLCLK